MTINCEEARRDLIEKYKSIMEKRGNNPEWAVKNRVNSNKLVSCTIPFVGEDYFKQDKKVLVYASAENLSGYYAGADWHEDLLDNEEKAIDRHRICFDNQEINKERFFPHVHLQPMNNGALATAVYYILTKMIGVGEQNPKEVYETIAFANYGKYSIETQRQKNIRERVGDMGDKSNVDYAGGKCYLAESEDFVKIDIEILQPDYIIMPASIYRREKGFIDGIKNKATIVPIYQINGGVINRTIAPKRKHTTVNKDDLPKQVIKWYDALEEDGMKVGSATKENYLKVFVYLDEIIKKLQENDPT